MTAPISHAMRPTPAGGMLSIVVPCYNEQESLPLLADALARVAPELKVRPCAPTSVELVLVDDGSCDGTLEEFRALEARARAGELPYEVRWVSFSRNFGKESGLLAGLTAARGDWVATMDADMQDPPSLLPQMWEEAATGEWDCVATRRRDRAGEPPIRSAFARLFYRLINKMSDTDIQDGARDFRLMSRQVVDTIVSMGEYNRFTKGIYGWVGFKTKWLSFENVERVAGTTKWNFWSLMLYAFDGIIAFSTAPLAIASVLGMVCCLIAVACAVIVIVRALAFGDPVAGWPSLMTVILLVGGAQLLCLGIIGQYLAKTYLESKHRPIYIVRESGDSAQEGGRRAE